MSRVRRVARPSARAPRRTARAPGDRVAREHRRLGGRRSTTGPSPSRRAPTRPGGRRRRPRTRRASGRGRRARAPTGRSRRTAADCAPPPMRNSRSTATPWARSASMPSASAHSMPSTAARATCAGRRVAPGACRAGHRWRRACSGCARPRGRARGRGRRRPPGRTAPAADRPGVVDAEHPGGRVEHARGVQRARRAAGSAPVGVGEPGDQARAVGRRRGRDRRDDAGGADRTPRRRRAAGRARGPRRRCRRRPGPSDRRRRWSGGPPRTGRARGGRARRAPSASSSRSWR